MVLPLLIASCGQVQVARGIHDPFEAGNRATHRANVRLDRNLIRPVANAYGTGVPKPVRTGIHNFATNLGEPATFVNSVLQLRPGQALRAAARFSINSTVGIAGLFDPATAFGITRRSSDFGETLHVWGAPEGNFVELPVLGPSTERDAAGTVVDFILNPLQAFLPTREYNSTLGVRAVDSLGRRYDFSPLIDSTLYNSADSYAQARILYLESRRYKLSGGRQTYNDPYANPYGNQ